MSERITHYRDALGAAHARIEALEREALYRREVPRDDMLLLRAVVFFVLTAAALAVAFLVWCLLS